jgi:hypothetical protein
VGEIRENRIPERRELCGQGFPEIFKGPPLCVMLYNMLSVRRIEFHEVRQIIGKQKREHRPTNLHF